MTEKEAKNQCLMIKKTSVWLKKEIAATMKLLNEAKDDKDIGVCRTRFTALGSELDKHKMPLTADERKSLSDKLSAAVKAIKEKQDGGGL